MVWAIYGSHAVFIAQLWRGNIIHIAPTESIQKGPKSSMLEWLIGKKRGQANSSSPTHISPQEVWDMIQSGVKVTILDVREQHEYRAGHIKGAQLIPLMHLSKRLHEVRNEHLVITVCRSGNRSAQAARLLRTHGYEVRNMRGGMLQWPGKVAK